MGMSSHVTGLREEDQQYLTNMRALQALLDAGVKILPKELEEYFGTDCVADADYEDVLEVDIYKTTKELEEEYKDGFIVDLSKLPPGVVKLKFWNSY